MKASELRIGNYLFGIDDGYRETAMEVNCINGDQTYRLKHGNDSVGCYSEIRPIPLTEEWLEKLGFKKNHPEISECFWNWWNKEKDFSVDVEYVLTDNGIEKLYYAVLQNINGYRPYKHIIYVHQLQNIIYALTGEELTINDGK